MDFVDNIDFKTRRRRVVSRRFDDFAHVCDAGVAGGVDFDNVDVAVFGDGAAMFANAAGFGRHAALAVGTHAVQGAGDDARGRRFADAANARQNVCLRQTVRFNGVFQRSNQSFLPDQIGKSRRTVFAGKDAVFVFVGHGFGRFRKKGKGNRTTTRPKPLRLLSSEPDRVDDILTLSPSLKHPFILGIFKDIASKK